MRRKIFATLQRTPTTRLTCDATAQVHRSSIVLSRKKQMQSLFISTTVDSVREATGENVPVSGLKRRYAVEIAALATKEGDFLSNVRELELDGDLSVYAARFATIMIFDRSGRIAKKGVAALLQLAAGGNNIARYNLALEYLSGKRLAADPRKAVGLLRAVVRSETDDIYLNGLALYALGNCHLDGKGVPANAKRAIALHEQAANYGVADAAFSVGLYHDRKNFNTHQGPVDFAKAARFYRRSAELGYVPAVTNLGVLYVEGLAQEPSPDAGWDLLERAAALGDDVAVDAINLFAQHAITRRLRG